VRGFESRGKWVAGQIAAVLAFALVIAGTGFVHARMSTTTRVERGEAFVPQPPVARVMAVGFDSVMADYYWLQAVQAIGGEESVSPELAAHLGKLVDVVTTLDPWVDHPYRFAAVWLTESEAAVRTANRLLRRGIEHHPDEWRNRFYLGFNLFYFLMEYDAAAEQLERASEIPGSPPYLGRLIARLRSQTADIDVSEAFLLELARNTEDPTVRNGYLAGLDEIEIEKKARYLDHARQAFNELNGRDIMRVDELVTGPHPILSALPSPEPESLPPSLSRGSVWKLDLESDDIVSTYYGYRYRLHFASVEREKAVRWTEERQRRHRGGDRPGTGLGEADDAVDSDQQEGASDDG